jgi:hypothetical protein
MDQMSHKRYSHKNIHRLLAERWPQRVPSYDDRSSGN